MTRKRKKTSATEGDGDSGGVTLDFGRLFSGIGDFVDLVGKLAESGEKHIERHGEFRVKGLGDQARGVYGFSIRSGIGGGGPRVQSFGNLYPSEDGLVVDDVREPLVDVFDEGDEIVVTAELAGALESEILVFFDDDVLMIETVGARRYFKEVQLPARVAAQDFQQIYNNGILEIRVRKHAAAGKEDA